MKPHALGKRLYTPGKSPHSLSMNGNATDLDAYLQKWEFYILKKVGRDKFDDFIGFVYLECLSKKLTTVNLRVLFHSYFDQCRGKESTVTSLEGDIDPINDAPSSGTYVSKGYMIKAKQVNTAAVVGSIPFLDPSFEPFDEDRKVQLLDGYLKRTHYVKKIERLNIFNQCACLANELYVKNNNGEDSNEFFSYDGKVDSRSKGIAIVKNRVAQEILKDFKAIKSNDLKIDSLSDEQYRFIDATSYGMTLGEISRHMGVDSDTAKRIDGELAELGFVPVERGTCTYFELAGIGLEDRNNLYIIALSYLGFSSTDISKKLKIPQADVDNSLQESNKALRFLSGHFDAFVERHPQSREVLNQRKVKLLYTLDKKALKYNLLKKASHEEQLAYLAYEAYRKFKTHKSFDEFLTSENNTPDKRSEIIKNNKALRDRMEYLSVDSIKRKTYADVSLTGRQLQFLELNSLSLGISDVAELFEVSERTALDIAKEIKKLGFPAIFPPHTYLEELGIGGRKRESQYIMALDYAGLTSKEIAERLQMKERLVVDLASKGRGFLGQKHERTLMQEQISTTYDKPIAGIEDSTWEMLNPNGKKYLTLAFKGMSNGQIAKHCNVHKGAVSSAISKAMKVLGWERLPFRIVTDTHEFKDAPLPKQLEVLKSTHPDIPNAWSLLDGQQRLILITLFDPSFPKNQFIKPLMEKLKLSEHVVGKAISQFVAFSGIDKSELYKIATESRDDLAISL